MIYFAAADCTGHGVPGAMVSVVFTLFFVSFQRCRRRDVVLGVIVDRSIKKKSENFEKIENFENFDFFEIFKKSIFEF